jgi:Zn finger protein HypA/HybF involved in hydrogenase expression
MFDECQAELYCQNCSHLSSMNENICMQTHLLSEAVTLRVGHVFELNEVSLEAILGGGYTLIAEPVASSPIRLLNTWGCPACEKEQWAIVEISDRRLSSIRAVPMNATALREANFISEVDGELLAAALLDIPTREFAERKLDAIEVLRQRLT